jgi:hypothetical protein
MNPRELTKTGMGTNSSLQLHSNDSQPGTAHEVEDIYQATQTYLYITITISDPLYPEPTLIKSDTASLLLKFKDPKKFPGTNDAIATYESAIKYIVCQVGQEYAKKQSEDDGGAQKAN